MKIKYRYSIEKDGHLTIIAVFEGDYVRFATELKMENWERKIMSDEEFEKLVKQE